MATPQRRSSRLKRGSSVLSGTPSSALPSKLDALLEDQDQIHTDNSAADSIAASNFSKKAADSSSTELVSSPQHAQTPMTTGRIRPDREEMHPAMFQSTQKKRYSARRLGITASLIDGSPSSRTGSAIISPKDQDQAANPFTAVSFDFRTAREHSVELSSEARKMMDELRADAAKYKEDIKKQQDEAREAEGVNALLGRKLMTPKGKASRFSDVHMKQFKQMDSIANHASSFRADPTRLTPAKSLKRSNSKAGLDDVDEATTPQRSISRRTPKTAPAAPPTQPVFKRVKTKEAGEETVTASATPNTTSRMNTGLPRATTASNLHTPTKASLARANSAKSLKEAAGPSKIPALSRASSVKNLSTPSKAVASPSIQSASTPQSKTISTPVKPAETPSKPTPAPSKIPQTENSLKFRDTLANKLQNVKSILRRPQIRYSDDPAKIAAGTHVATPQSGTPARKQGQMLFKVPKDPGSPAHRAEKHVNFSASTNLLDAPSQEPVEQKSPGTPSPTKKASLPAGMHPSVAYPALPTNAGPGSNPPSSPTPAYANFKRPAPPAAAARDFTFRVGSAITFSSPLKPNTPSIRHVSSNAVPATTSRLPAGSISHGLTNKKRKHGSNSSEDSDKENSGEPGDGSPIKRRRVVSTVGKANDAKKVGPRRIASTSIAAAPAVASAGQKVANNKRPGASFIPTSKIDRKTVGSSNKRGLSAARLNALAAPKKR